MIATLVAVTVLACTALLFVLANRLTATTIANRDGVVYHRTAMPLSQFSRGTIAPLVTAVMAAVPECLAVRVYRRGHAIVAEAIVPWTAAPAKPVREAMRVRAESAASKVLFATHQVLIVYR